MFHVSTLLPFSADDEQQVERKRHLGNDTCVIVFVDGNDPFRPDTIRSKFCHVIAVVRVYNKSRSVPCVQPRALNAREPDHRASRRCRHNDLRARPGAEQRATV